MRTLSVDQANRMTSRGGEGVARRGGWRRAGGRVALIGTLAGCVVGLSSGDPALAQWRATGTPVSTIAGAHDAPMAAPDGAGGAIVVWGDQRSGPTSDVYAQRFDALGQRLWSVGGQPVCTAQDAQFPLAIVPAASHGAFVLWTDARAAIWELYAQRLDADGNPLWTANGVGVCPGIWVSGESALVADGADGMIAAWSDYRNGNADVYAQRLGSTGSPLWGANGVPVCTAASGQVGPRAVADGTGGAYFVWLDARGGGGNEIYAQRLTSAGTPAWASNGVRVTTSSTGDPCAVSDGAGGVAVAWFDDAGVHAQRLDSAGQAQWGAGGVLVATGANAVEMAASGSGTVTVAFNHYLNADDADIFAQRLDAAGSPLWATGGAAVMTHPGTAEFPAAIDVDPAGVAVVLAISPSDTTYRVQRVAASGTRQWDAAGIAIRPSDMGGVVTDGDGGAIVVWLRPESGSIRRTCARRIPAAGVRTVSLGWSGGGHVEILDPAPSIAYSVTVTPLEDALFRAVPNSGYYAQDVALDGASLGVPPNLELGHPTANHTVFASFANGSWAEPPVSTSPRAYGTVAFPLTFAYDSVRAVLSELGPYDDTVWRLARWNPDSAAYQFAGQGFHRLEAGAGYWLITANGAQVQADGTPLTADTVGVKLKGNASSGWNQISNPYRFAIADTALRVLGPGGLVGFTSGANTLTDALIWEWKGGSNYDSVRTVLPRKAYWVQKLVSTPVSLVFPNWSSQIVSPGPASLPAGAEWTVALRARQGEATSMRVLAGRWSRTAGSAALRLEAPPGSPDGGLSLRLRDAGGGGAGRVADFTRDDGPWSWELELRGAEAPGEVTLECEASGLPAGLRLWLSDDAREWCQELRPGEPVTLAAAADGRRLRLHAAFTGEIPAGPAAAAGIAAAYPNPFRERVGIVLRLPSAATVFVSVYDVQGRQVRSLDPARLAPGEHVLVWDGRDDAGRTCPSGLYFARCHEAGPRGSAKLMKLP